MYVFANQTTGAIMNAISSNTAVFFSPGTKIGAGGVAGCALGGLVFGGLPGAAVGTLIGLAIPIAQCVLDGAANETEKATNTLIGIAKIFSCCVVAIAFYYFSGRECVSMHRDFSWPIMCSCYGMSGIFYLAAAGIAFFGIKIVSDGKT